MIKILRSLRLNNCPEIVAKLSEFFIVVGCIRDEIEIDDESVNLLVRTSH